MTINLPVLNLARGHPLCFAQIKIDEENFGYSSSSSQACREGFWSALLGQCCKMFGSLRCFSLFLFMLQRHQTQKLSHFADSERGRLLIEPGLNLSHSSRSLQLTGGGLLLISGGGGEVGGGGGGCLCRHLNAKLNVERPDSHYNVLLGCDERRRASNGKTLTKLQQNMKLVSTTSFFFFLRPSRTTVFVLDVERRRRRRRTRRTKQLSCLLEDITSLNLAVRPAGL